MTWIAERPVLLVVGQAFLSGCEGGSAQRDPGVGDVKRVRRLDECLQGAGGESLSAAGVAVAEQELCARLPYLRRVPTSAETSGELFGLGEVALGFIAIACAEPRSAQRVQALQTPRATATSRRSRSASWWWCPAAAHSCLVSATVPRLARIVLWITRSRSASDRPSRSSRAAPNRVSAAWMSPPKYCGGGHDAVTAGAQAGI